MMLIDKKTGALSLAGNVYPPGMTFAQFDLSPVGASAKPMVNNPPWKSYWHRFIDNTSGIWTFKNDCLVHVSLAVLQAKGSNSFLNNESERKNVHDQVLAEMLGSPPYSYEWGEVLSLLEPRSQEASIDLRYKGSF